VTTQGYKIQAGGAQVEC